MRRYSDPHYPARRFGTFFPKSILILAVAEEEVALEEAPAGPVLCEGELCWKLNAMSKHGVAAYRSGGAFIQKTTPEEQRALCVRPVTLIRPEIKHDSSLLGLLHQIAGATLEKTADPEGMAEILAMVDEAIRLARVEQKDEPPPEAG